MKKKIYSSSLQGKRNENEDNHFHIININDDNTNINPINLFGVFDGHGGKLVSLFLKRSLPKYFLNKNKFYQKTDIATDYFNKVYDLLQNKLVKKHPKATQYCGSTACVGLLYNYHNKKNLWVLNVGDSRAIKCNKSDIAEQLTLDHKPNVPNEKKRIEALGGIIEYDGYDWRIKGLSLSRAFGDLDCNPFVNHKPDIYNYEINDDDKFIIFGCDGLYDMLSNQDIIDFINENINKNFNGNYAKILTEYAIQKGSLDNITCIIYFI